MDDVIKKKKEIFCECWWVDVTVYCSLTMDGEYICILKSYVMNESNVNKKNRAIFDDNEMKSRK